jgi:predicted dehydrogenase
VSDRASVVIVGAGGIARGYADVLAASTETVAVGVADVVPEAAQALAERLDCEWGTDPGALVGAADPDVVVVCTPPVTREDLVGPLLAAGRPVLAEKPLAMDRHASRRLVETAASSGALLGLATKFRYCDDVRRVAELLAAGDLGQPRLVEVAFTSRVDMRSRWNSDPSISGGGVVIDNGTHAVDLLRFLLGDMAEVLAVEQSRPDGMVVEDCARLMLRAESGADAFVDLAWSIDKSLGDFLKVFGTEGEARVGWGASSWRRYGEDWQVIGSGYAKVPSMGGALEQFCRAARGVEPLAVSGADGVAAACIVDAAHESLRRGGWIKIADLDD